MPILECSYMPETDLPDVLYQSDREYISKFEAEGWPSFGVFLRLHLSFG